MTRPPLTPSGVAGLELAFSLFDNFPIGHSLHGAHGASGHFPRVTEFVLNADHLDDETQMWAGVELILDGIAARLEVGR